MGEERGMSRGGGRHNARRLTLVLCLSIVILGVALVGQAVAANNITYNLFATDGYVSLADGTVLYNYGFVGGRSDQDVVYQNSMIKPPGWAPVAGFPAVFTPGALVTAPAGYKWPQPVGGASPVGSLENQIRGNVQFPAPLIYCNVGDTVTINMKNLGTTSAKAPNDPHTIHLHGLDVDAANDGVPETSLAAVPGNLLLPGAGNVVVYMFQPSAPGTYMYHCHQEADIHVQMGMYGALIVYEAGDPRGNRGPGDGGGVPGTMNGNTFTKDVVMLLSEVDINQHISEQKGRVGAGAVYNPVNYHPQYWMINGLSWPNTAHLSGGPLAPFNWTNWIAAHKGYDPLIIGSVTKTYTDLNPVAPDPNSPAPPFTKGVGDKVLIHVINMGYEAQPMHMHGFHGLIFATDERKLAHPYQKQTLLVGSGETYEWLVDFSQTSALAGPATLPLYQATAGASNENLGTQTRYDAVTKLPKSNTYDGVGRALFPAIPVPLALQPFTYIAGPTVQGLWGPTPLTAVPVAAAAPALANAQVFPFHNHDDYKATNNGVYPGGQFTAIIPQP